MVKKWGFGIWADTKKNAKIFQSVLKDVFSLKTRMKKLKEPVPEIDPVGFARYEINVIGKYKKQRNPEFIKKLKKIL